MSKEQFLYNETKPVFDLIEDASQRSGVSRGQAFEDFLHVSVCAMSGGKLEDQYLAVVERHKHGKPGRRASEVSDCVGSRCEQPVHALVSPSGAGS